MNRIMKRKQKGFTLVELIITGVVIAILAALAIPQYQDYVKRARRVDCGGVLMKAAGVLERRHSALNSYLKDPSYQATDVKNMPDGTTCPADGGKTTYTVTISDVGISTFLLTAVPTGIQAGDKCGTLYLNALGDKGANGKKPGEATTAADKEGVARCWH